MSTRSREQRSRKVKVAETVMPAKGVNESLTSADKLEAEGEPEGTLEAEPEGELEAEPTVEPGDSQPPSLPPPEAAAAAALAGLEEPPPPPAAAAAAAAAVPTAAAAATTAAAETGATAPPNPAAAAVAVQVAAAPVPLAVVSPAPAITPAIGPPPAPAPAPAGAELPAAAPAVALTDGEYRSEYGYTEREYYDDSDYGYSDYGASDDHYLYEEGGGDHHAGHAHVGYRGYPPSQPAAVEPAEEHNQPNQPSEKSSLEETVSAPELKTRGTIEYGPIKTTVNIGGATFTMCQAKFTGEQHGFGPGLRRSQPECTDANLATILTVYKSDVTFHKPFLCEGTIIDGKVMLSCRRVDKSKPTGNTCPTEQWKSFQALDPSRIHAAIAEHHRDDLTRKQEQTTLAPAGFTSPGRTRGMGPRRRGRREREREICVCMWLLCGCVYSRRRAPSMRKDAMCVWVCVWVSLRVLLACLCVPILDSTRLISTLSRNSVCVCVSTVCVCVYGVLTTAHAFSRLGTASDSERSHAKGAGSAGPLQEGRLHDVCCLDICATHY
jgi:hypothetical protein